MKNNQIKVALIGNPNVGKTSVFNILTGLNQQVGNYPGITVCKKTGICKLSQIQSALIYDLPGTYSINPNSLDEKVTVNTLLDKNNIDFPDVVVFIADIENLKQNLLLFSQIKGLNIPVIFAINMADRMQKNGISINIPLLEEKLHTKVILVSTWQKTGIDQLKNAIIQYKKLPLIPCFNIEKIDELYFKQLKERFQNKDAYKLWLIISQNFDKIEAIRKQEINQEFVKSDSELKRMQQRETILRYQFINQTLKDTYTIDIQSATGLRAKLDRILIHKFWGYIIFSLILLLIFQVIYNFSEYPMEWIETLFRKITQWIEFILPQGPLTDLITKGILAGISGIVVFIPQIACLFLFISLLEESGYMSRVVFLMDRIMRPFGLNGKSIIPFISGAACAIPAVMSTRNIESWKERLISILVAPFITCSARLPIYIIIIGLVIPEGNFLFFSYKGLTLFALYFAGVFVAIASAWILNKILVLKNIIRTPFVIEMPNYKLPLFRNVSFTVLEKTKAFIFGAGKIILAISVIIWFLQKHGFSQNYKNAEIHTEQMAKKYHWNNNEKANYLLSYQTENSLLGNIGKTIEPIFSPLGYDWKISIGVLSSFAAREVFISTLSTIYTLGEDIDLDEQEQQKTIINRMKNEIRSDGSPVFSFATGISILLFYAFAMQCLSTIAIVKRETNSWKWVAIQWIMMTGFAYLSALLAYQFLK